MHILVVSQYFWPENFRINDLVEELVQRGHNVTVLTGIPNYPSGEIFTIYRKKPSNFGQYKGAKVLRVPMLTRGNDNFLLMLNYLSFVISGCTWGAWLLRGIKVDVIFVFEPSPVTVGLPAIWIAKIKKIPIVFWVLDLWPETLAAVGAVRSTFVLGLFGYIVRFIYNRCTLVLGQSRGFMESIGNYCSNKAKIRYFPNWAEGIFKEVDVLPAPELHKLENVFSIVFAGNIGEAQDMPAVLDAAEKLNNNPFIRWIIVGDGRKSEWIHAEVIRRGLNKMILLGHHPPERMPSFYAHADALLVSLKRDPVFSMTIPGKLQSYLYVGKPLLGMLDGEGATLIKDAGAGLTCAAGDSVELAKAVLALADMSEEERRQLGLNGKRYAKNEFDRTRLMDYLEELLREAVTKGKAETEKDTYK